MFAFEVVNNNIQLVNMWLSTEDTTVLDNALITMEHLYKTGTMNIHLRRLMNEQSCFEIEYSIDKIQTTTTTTIETHYESEIDQDQELEKIKFTLSMADVEDHKRQLTFCSVDLPPNMIHKKLLLNEQLKLLQLIEKIYLIFVQLEMAGHPDYQFKDENYDIHDRTGQMKKTFSHLIFIRSIYS